ncbi:MAG: glutamyl-tRNA synthetase [Parcubacteria group bacterium Gr01-1014_48]|nr:MAG: glutamyl-tRNA synthetase [Parcubacteria group bacterium Greene0416_14]TSC74141.1 MAG: glutamyl-tRNA synthetase [Parcubacteria group bacterium Gr01-1014_48]TSD01702.1 MAG: glutamyl-tRNA synthetase [Parcubacteria group bacterium Greene1014_15]TSD08164.1 MAG: glutamyl-tRNA synthetase [Parcubacteria group bacterium Greene0714_4]
MWGYRVAHFWESPIEYAKIRDQIMAHTSVGNISVITRFPPSPTGKLHIGNARTALFNYLFTKHHGGKIILRFEDTDRARSKKEYEENILDALAWLGIKFAETYRQSERNDIYRKYLERLITENTAYVSNETDEAGKQSSVVRFRNPNKKITFTDIVRGDITFDTEELKDFVIARSIDDPIYHFAVVVDDFEMGLTHIIRGEDHISNTPRQILIQEAIGAPRPVYAHLPLILSKDRSKLSKRSNAVATTEYRDLGYLPEGIVNYLALLGWNPGTEQEIFTLSELIEQFDIEKIQKGGAVFDIEKLNWVNKEHIRRIPQDTFETMIQTYIPKEIMNESDSKKRLHRLIPLIQEKAEILCDVKNQFEQGEYAYIFEAPREYDISKLMWKDEKDPKIASEKLSQILKILSEIPSNDFSEISLKEKIWDFATNAGRGTILWPMRYALSGRERSPDPFSLGAILGKEETLARIEKAISALKNREGSIS